MNTILDLYLLSFHILFELLWVMRYKLYIPYTFGTFKGRERSLCFGRDIEWCMADGTYADRAALMVFRAFKFVGDVLWWPGYKKPAHRGLWLAYTKWLPEDVMTAMHSYYGITGEKTVLYVRTDGSVPRDAVLKLSLKEIGPDGDVALGYDIYDSPGWVYLALSEELRLEKFDQQMGARLEYYEIRSSGEIHPDLENYWKSRQLDPPELAWELQ